MAEVDTLIFDVDDTLYPVSSGFSDHRNGEVICEFMLERLGFTCRDTAMQVRHEYFRRYHSSMKGLRVACEEGKTPRPFREEDLADWFASRCDFSMLQPDPVLAEMLRSLGDDAGLNLVVFSNAPRRYVLNCLVALGVRHCFDDAMVFGVEDVLPTCKPEAAAFDRILKAIGSRPERAVMFEDSMKNVLACHAMGIHTVLIHEARLGAAGGGGEAKLLSDVPCSSHPAVGLTLQHICELRERLPGLWHKRFERSSATP